MSNSNVKCPNCKEVFKVDDSVYTDIVKQVRDQEFQDELKNRLDSAEKEKQSVIDKSSNGLMKNWQREAWQDVKVKAFTKAINTSCLLQNALKIFA